MKPRLLLFIPLFIAGISGLWFARHSASFPPIIAPDKPITPAAPADTLASALARILAERDDVRRLQLLSTWVDTHTLEEIGTALASVSDAEKSAVNELVQLKLRDLSATLSPAEFSKQEWMYLTLSSGRSPFPPSLSETLLTIAETDPVTAFHQAVKTRMIPQDREQTMIKILGRLALKDPHQALALLSQTRSLHQQNARRIIAENWTKTDPQAALAWSLTQPASNTQQLTQTVLTAWSEQDPASALEAATTLPPGTISDYTTADLLKRWFRSSPAESLDWINDQPTPGPLILKSAIEALGRTHPQDAAALLEKPMTTAARRASTQALVEIWSNSDPLAASRWLQTRPKDSAYFAAATELVGSLAGKDPSAAFALYRTLPADAELGEITRKLAGGLTGQNAFDWLITLPPSRDAADALADAARRMNFTEPAQYLALLSHVPPGPQQDAIYLAATRRQLESNPAGTSEWMRNLPTPAIRDSVLTAIASEWINTSPAAASEWVATLPANSSNTRSLIQNAFSTLATKTPQIALERIGQLPSGPARTAALNGIVNGLSQTNPQEAARTLTTLGSPTEQAAIAGTLVYTWCAREPVAATTWVKNLPAGAIRDAGLSQLANPLARSDPSASLALLPLATSDDTRYQIARRSLLVLQERDEQSARTALALLTLTPATLARLKETLDDHAER